MTEPKAPLEGKDDRTRPSLESPVSTKEPISPFDISSPYRVKSLTREWTRRSVLPEGPIAPRAAEEMFGSEGEGEGDEGVVEEHKPGVKGWLCVLGVSCLGTRSVRR